MEFIQVVTGTRSEHIGRYTPSTRRAWPGTSRTSSALIGIAGPLRVDGEHAQGDF
jgi:hypothetical protein